MREEPKSREELQSIKPYVPGKPIEEVQRELGIADVIKLASNENPLGPPPSAVRAISETVSNIQRYPDGSAFKLKNAIAKKYGVEHANILTANGSDESIKLVAEAYLNPGEEVIIPWPSFSEYEFATKVMGGRCVISPLDEEFRLDLGDMVKKVTPKTKIIFVVTPNNPTGTIVGREEVERFLSRYPRTSWLSSMRLIVNMLLTTGIWILLNW